MRKIDELIEDIILCEEDYLHIKEVPLEEDEYQAVKNMTINKIRILQESDQGEHLKLKKRAKKLNKKMKVFLISAVLMASGTTLIAGVGGTIEEIFRVILGESASNIGTSGVILGVSDSVEGINLNVVGAIGDKNIIQLLVDLQKENGELFDGEGIKFDEVSLELEGEEGIDLLGLTKWWTYDAIKAVEDEPSMRKIKLKMGDIEGIEGKKATLTAKNIVEYTERNIVSQVELVDCLINEEQGMTIPNKDKRYDEKLIALGDEQEIAFKESIPTYLLPSGGLNIVLYPEVPTLKLDNIGFVGQKLHIRIKGSDENLILEDAQGNRLDPTYSVKNDGNGYYVYAIADRTELSQIRCLISLDEEIRRTEGVWQVRFDINTQSEVRKVDIGMEIPLTNVRNIEVIEIELSQLSLAVTYRETERILKYPDISIAFKDGSKNLVSDKEVHLNIKSGELRQCIYDFDKPIDVEQVESIMINNSIILLK